MSVDLLGCRNRGLLAVTIALIGGVLGVVSAVQAVIGRAQEEMKIPFNRS